jgi:anaerobic selenocysteine-containing dehydrogenase
MDRRSFIKLTAITGTSAALASCGNPEHQLIRFVPAEDIVPGVAQWRPGVCPMCASGCGLTVRVMDADADVVRNGQAGVVQILAAKKLEGAPGHPVNQGALCARGQAAIQAAYHPDRITQPLRRTGERGDGQYAAVSWETAIQETVDRLNAVATADSRAVTFITRRNQGHRRLVVDEFLARFGAPGPVVYEVLGDDVLRRANAVSFGRAQLPTLDLANARYVISFGADFLGTWNSPVSQSLAYGAMRQGRPGLRGTFVQVEARMSQTGANADTWVPVRPGTEGVLALGLAHVLAREGARRLADAGRAGAAIAGWSEGLPDFAPDRVEAMTGAAAARIERLARELADSAPALAVVGGAPLAHTNGTFTALAVNALNAMLGAVDRPGGLLFTPQFDVRAAAGIAGSAADPRSIAQLAEAILAGDPAAPQALFIDGANPVFGAPRAWRVGEALARVPFIVSFGSFLDETAALADLILPDHSFLESWVDAIPESGAEMAVISAAPPVMRPLHDTRPMPDVLAEIGRALDRPVELPWQTFEEMLAATFAALPGPSADIDAWTDAQEKGGWWGELPGAVTRRPGAAQAGASAASFTEPQFDGAAGEYPLHLLPYASPAFLDGSLAHLPWLQEMPDPVTSAMWSSWIEINPATAERLGIAQGDVVEVASSQGTLRSRAMITPGIAPDVAAMPVGQGHRTFTRYASGRGENPLELIAPLTDGVTGELAWGATRVRVSRAAGPDGGLILFAGGMREHADRGR